MHCEGRFIVVWVWISDLENSFSLKKNKKTAVYVEKKKKSIFVILDHDWGKPYRVRITGSYLAIFWYFKTH